MIISGKYTDAYVFTDNIEPECVEQIKNIVDNEHFKYNHIALMPDCHAGKGCCIGFTQHVMDSVCPNLVGVDIGCGMLCAELAEDISTDDFLNACKNVPVGKHVHETLNPEMLKYCGMLYALFTKFGNGDYLLKSIGTLGGGNHFIELNVSEKTGKKYVVIHSGSRNLGVKVCEYWMSKATGEGDLKFLTGENMQMYLHDVMIAQSYASVNRYEILRELGFKVKTSFETIHNYIDPEFMILRKGAISALMGEKCLIPMNMRDGSLLCEGLGNLEWNMSAPHGAGRLMSRAKAKKSITLSDYQNSMKGIASNSVRAETIDESPMVYKDAIEIESLIDGKTVKVLDHLKVLANHKGF